VFFAYIQRIARDLDHNQGRLAYLNSVVKQMEPICDASSARDQLTQLNQQMYNLQSDSAAKLSSLEEAHEEIEDFEADLASLRQWMDDTRAQLTMRDASRSLKDQLAMQEVVFLFIKELWIISKRKSQWHVILIP